MHSNTLTNILLHIKFVIHSTGWHHHVMSLSIYVSALLCCSSKFTVGYPGDSCIQKDDASRMREIVFQKVLRHHTASLFTDFMDRETPASWREKKPAVLLLQRCLERIPTSFPRCSHRERMCHPLSMNT